LIILILFTAILPSYYFYSKYEKNRKLLENPREAAREELGSLIEEVGKVVELPGGEEPTAATVSDKEKLKNQPFFARSENGDRVLIYTQAKKAILYRPSIHKVIDIAPLIIGPSENTPTPTIVTSENTPAPTKILKPVRVSIYNGTPAMGFSLGFEKKLKEKYGEKIEITERETAGKNTYSEILVVNLTGKDTTLAEDISQFLGAKIGALPEGEIRPEADILIILGK